MANIVNRDKVIKGLKMQKEKRRAVYGQQLENTNGIGNPMRGSRRIKRTGRLSGGGF